MCIVLNLHGIIVPTKPEDVVDVDEPPSKDDRTENNIQD